MLHVLSCVVHLIKAYSKLGPFGGAGGEIKDMDPSDISRIVKIGIRHGGAIDGFFVRYVRNGGQEESTDLWGAEGGDLTEVTVLLHFLCHRLVFSINLEG
jgi:hypothetical protein